MKIYGTAMNIDFLRTTNIGNHMEYQIVSLGFNFKFQYLYETKFCICLYWIEIGAVDFVLRHFSRCGGFNQVFTSQQ